VADEDPRLDNRQQQRFQDLVWPHAAVVLRVAQIMTGGDAAEADDLAQECLLKAYRGIDTLADGTDTKAWLMTILRHARIDRVRSAAARGRYVPLDDLGADEPTASNEAEWRELSSEPEDILQEFSDRQVIRALQALPEEIRWTLLLTDVEGMDHKEAAEVLGVPVGTVKSRTHRGRRMLRQALLPLAKEMRLGDQRPAAEISGRRT
jgi:RNA polymerase sigma-70 factor (ECF subfamily)